MVLNDRTPGSVRGRLRPGKPLGLIADSAQPVPGRPGPSPVPFFPNLAFDLGHSDPIHQTRTALLTPGPQNETYFEHAYLAGYLDYTLVQGEDLTVRDGCLWLKTVGGLQQVGVVVRRVDDTFCDPLELQRESLLAPPGLLQAVRNNTVVVANPLGSGVLETPG